MALKIALHHASEIENDFWLKGGLTFQTPHAMSANTKALWNNVVPVSIEDTTKHFSCDNMDIGLTLLVRDKNSVVRCCAAFFQKDSLDTGSYPIRPNEGFLAIQFNSSKNLASISSAHVSSAEARHLKFLPRMMQSFMRINEAIKTESVGIISTGAGVYAWAAYGAAPSDMISFIEDLTIQWRCLVKSALAVRLTPPPELEEWVSKVIEEKSRESFRTAFSPDKSPEFKVWLKALMLGDIDLVQIPNQRFNSYIRNDEAYGRPLSGHYMMELLSPHFRDHFSRRITHALNS